MSEKRYYGKITFECGHQGGEKMMDGEVNYYNLGYRDLVNVEGAIMGGLAHLGEQEADRRESES